MSIPRFIPFAALTLVVGCATEDPAPDANPPVSSTTPVADDEITPALRDSVLWKRYEEVRPTDHAALITSTDSLQEYAAKCDAAVGLHVPAFSCDAGIELPGQMTSA